MSKRTAVILVILLFLGAVFQSVVIVDYYSESFNIGFFENEAQSGTYYKSLDDNISARYFKPFEIIIRYDEKSLVLDEGKSPYGSIWTDAKSVINDVFSDGFVKSGVSWIEACMNPGITVFMGRYFPSEYISLMTGAEDMTDHGLLIDKIMFVPRENSMAVYIHAADGVYEKTGMEPYGLFNQENFSVITDFINNDPEYAESFMTDLFRLTTASVIEGYIEPDILVNNDTEHHDKGMLWISIPNAINEYREAVDMAESTLRDKLMEQVSDSIKTRLFGGTSNLYETHVDMGGNLFFSNNFNTYEISKNGWISYKYTPGTTGDNIGDIKNAFINAYETLNSIAKLSMNAVGDTFVSKITVNDESYTFYFDYKYDSEAIVLEDSRHAIEITATGTRTIEARILLLNHKELPEESQVSIPYVYDFNINRTINGYGNLNDLEAYRIYIGYGVFSGESNYLRPVWVIEKKSGEKEVYSLLRGDE